MFGMSEIVNKSPEEDQKCVLLDNDWNSTLSQYLYGLIWLQYLYDHWLKLCVLKYLYDMIDCNTVYLHNMIIECTNILKYIWVCFSLNVICILSLIWPEVTSQKNLLMASGLVWSLYSQAQTLSHWCWKHPPFLHKAKTIWWEKTEYKLNVCLDVSYNKYHMTVLPSSWIWITTSYYSTAQLMNLNYCISKDDNHLSHYVRICVHPFWMMFNKTPEILCCLRTVPPHSLDRVTPTGLGQSPSVQRLTWILRHRVFTLSCLSLDILCYLKV